MAHEIINGIDVCLTREHDAPAWHGLDNRVPEITADVLRRSNFVQEVEAQPLFTQGDDGVQLKAPAKALVIGSGTPQARAISVVGPRYGFAEDGYGSLVRLIEPLLNDGLVSIVSAGTLQGYLRAYLTCELQGDLTAAISTGDTIKRYWTLTDALDGVHASTSFTADTRIVCANTLASAVAEASNMRKIRHSTRFEMRREEWRDMVIAERARLDANATAFRTLQQKQIDAATLDAYLRECFELEENETPRNGSRFQFALETHDKDIARGTMWGAYNAAQSTIQWHSKQGATTAARLGNAWFGSGFNQNQRFLDAAMMRLAA